MWILRSKTILAVLCTLIVSRLRPGRARRASGTGFRTGPRSLSPVFVAGFLCFHSESALDSSAKFASGTSLLVAGVALLMSGYVTQREMHDILRVGFFTRLPGRSASCSLRLSDIGWTSKILRYVPFRMLRTRSTCSITSIVIVIATLLLGGRSPADMRANVLVVVVATTTLLRFLSIFLIRFSHPNPGLSTGAAPSPEAVPSSEETPRVPGCGGSGSRSPRIRRRARQALRGLRGAASGERDSTVPR